MNLQERIDFILNKNFPASVKRKHLVHLMQHLNDYSEDADDLGTAYTVIAEAIEQLDTEIGTSGRIEFRVLPRGSGKQAYMEEMIKHHMAGNERFQKVHIPNNLYGKFNTPQPLTVTELDRTLEFFLTYNILSMQQVQEIRAKAAAYLR